MEFHKKKAPNIFKWKGGGTNQVVIFGEDEEKTKEFLQKHGIEEGDDENLHPDAKLVLNFIKGNERKRMPKK